MSKLQVDALSSITNWVVNSPSTITQNAFTDYIAGLNSASLLIMFATGDSIKTATKTLSSPVDVTDYNTLVFSIWSWKKGKQVYDTSADFDYKIKINNTDEFYITVWDTFTHVNIDLTGITSITQIKITALHSNTDYIIISEMVAENEETNYDVLNATQETLDYQLNLDHSDGISVGTITGTTGDGSITFSTKPNYLARYSVIKIDDGVNEETHQINDSDGSKFYFNANYDGATLLNNFTNATVYLTFPTYINPTQQERNIPGIAIWGFEPEKIGRSTKAETITDSYSVNNDNFKERIQGEILKYTISLDCDSRSYELLDKMAHTIRKILGKQRLWVNGRKHEIEYAENPIEIKPAQGIDIIPKVQYTFAVEVEENIYDRATVPKTTSITTTVVTVTEIT